MQLLSGKSDEIDKMLFRAARRAKTRTYPELTGDVGRARFVVLATKGLWSEETQVFVRQLAKAKARAAPVPLQTRARAAWLQRWRTILACCSKVVRDVSSGGQRRTRQ